MYEDQQTWLLNPDDRARVYRRKAFECRQLAGTPGLSEAEREGYLLVADAYERSLDDSASIKPNRIALAFILRAVGIAPGAIREQDGAQTSARI